MAEIYALGEVLADVVVRPAEKLYMEGNAGGAPANCLAAAARLGADCAVIAKVGSDAAGSWLAGVLAENGIDTTYLLRSTLPTTLAMVSLDAHGERSFSFYRHGCADTSLCEADVPYAQIAGAKIFHFGSVSMTEEPSRSATLAAARFAKEHGALVSFDPNLRPSLWESPEDAARCIREGIALADFIKVSDDELLFLTGTADPVAGAAQLLNGKAKLLAVTYGAAGCHVFWNGLHVQHGGFCVRAVDTTGSGDAFDGAMLWQLLQQRCDLFALTEETLRTMAAFANAAGALTATRRGAIAVMPTHTEIEALRAAQTEH